MRTEQLIADLAARAAPVRPLPSPGRRALTWLLLTSGVAAAHLWLFGPRPDVTVRLTQADFLSTAMLALAASMLAGFVTLVLAIPGGERTPYLRWSSVGVVGLWALAMIRAVVSAGAGLPVSTDIHWPACFARVIVIAFVPALMLFVMVRRALPLRPAWAGGLAAVAAASMGAVVTQIACPLDDPGHAFLGHFIPVAIVAVTGVALRRTLTSRT
jgi:hypothetical protein